MKLPVSSIHLYDIEELNAYAGVDAVSNNFYVFNDTELTLQEKWFHPSRSAHFPYTFC